MLVNFSFKSKWFGAIVFWLGLILFAFYWFFWRLIQPFDHHGLYPSGTISENVSSEVVNLVNDILPEDERTQIVVFHWLDLDCQCSLLARLFIEKLSQKQFQAPVKHIILIPPVDKSEQNVADEMFASFNLAANTSIQILSLSDYQRSKLILPATPAATVFNQADQSLSYLGPHSSGVTCGQGTNYIDLVINNLTHGFDPQLYELESSGCFCSW